MREHTQAERSRRGKTMRTSAPRLLLTLPCCLSFSCFCSFSAGAPFLRFDFTLCRLVVLETELAFNSTRRILRQHCIEHDRSADLRESNGDASAVDGAEEKHADAQDWPSNNGAQQQEMEEEEEAHEAAQESDEADERQPPAGAGSAI